MAQLEREVSRVAQARRQTASIARGLRATINAVREDAKRQLAGFERDMVDFGSRMRESTRAVQQRERHVLLLQAKDLERANTSRVESLRAEIKHLKERLGESEGRSTLLQTSREQMEAMSRAELVELAGKNKELSTALEAAREREKAAQKEVSLLATERDGLREEIESRSAEAHERDARIAALERQAETVQSSFLGLLAAVRSKASLPQSVLDDLVDPQQFASQGLARFHQALDEALASRDDQVVERAMQPLRAKVSELEATRGELASAVAEHRRAERELSRLRERAEGLERQLADLRERLAEESTARTETQQQVQVLEDRMRQITAESRAEQSRAREQFDRSLEALKSSHAQQTDALRASLAASEARARDKLAREKAREKARAKQLREQLLATPPSLAASMRGLGSSAAALGSSGPGTPRRSSAAAVDSSEGSLRHLLGRSAALDVRAAALRASTSSHASSSSSFPASTAPDMPHGRARTILRLTPR
mmetsp:Transcript_26304/g.83542  ORF Transcript_26304/g.83542 Transcript_26304/m.83542 type:complete len:488 (+) Transcript_26304:1-1464(+)